MWVLVVLVAVVFPIPLLLVGRKHLSPLEMRPGGRSFVGRSGELSANPQPELDRGTLAGADPCDPCPHAPQYAGAQGRSASAANVSLSISN